MKNLLLEKFFKIFDTDTIGLEIYCKKKAIENPEEIIEEFTEIRTSVFDYLWNITKPNIQLNLEEISNISELFLREKYSWMNDKGIKAINNYVLWMSWHEGIMKK